jgi:hypothetical protein
MEFDSKKLTHSLLFSWKHISSIHSCLYNNICPYSYDLLIRMHEVCCCGKKYLPTRPYKKFSWFCYNYNKARINIGNQHDYLMELKEASRVQTDAEVALRHKCKHQCHRTCSSEIGTCIIHKLHTQKKTNENTHFLVESLQTMFYTHILKVYIIFQCKKKTFKKMTKLTCTIPLNIMTFCYVYLLYILLVSFQLSISCQSEDISHTSRSYYLD